jgi:HK97 family phage major capsid protein
MSKLDNLRDKKSRLIFEATELTQRGLNTATARSEHARLLAEIDGTIEHINMIENVETRLRSSAPAPVASPAPAVITQRDSTEHRAKVNAAARKFFRDGANGLNVEERALLTTSDSAGGALISQSFDDVFVEASKFYGPIWNLVNRKDAPTGEQTKFVVTDGTNQTFSLLSEGTTAASSVAQQPTVLSHITSVDTLVSSVVYSVQEADDATDLNAFLNRLAGTALSRARETAITLGTSNDGTATALINCPSGGLLGSVTTGATTESLAAGIGYSDLVALAGSVDHSYYVNGAYLSSSSVHAYLLGQKDETGRPYYNVDSESGLLMVNGKKLYVNAAMPAYNAASSPVVLFGDFSKAWNVLNAGLRLRVIGNNEESPALQWLTRELVIWQRIGQSAGLSSAVKALVTAAS